MKLVFCPFCNDLKAIVRFKRDDPVLDCGHVLTIETKASPMAESLAITLNSLITAKVNEKGGKISRDYAAKLVFEDIKKFA